MFLKVKHIQSLICLVESDMIMQKKNILIFCAWLMKYQKSKKQKEKTLNNFYLFSVPIWKLNEWIKKAELPLAQI